MTSRDLNNTPTRSEPPAYSMYSPDLQPLLQSLLTTLTNIDFEYEREQEKLSKTVTDVNLKIRVLEKLRERHRERRQPYIHQLAILQERIYRQMN